jgi:hypothetical protein
MVTYTQYQIQTGEIVVAGSTNTEVLPFVVLDGCAYLEGYGENPSQYVSNNVIVDYTPEQKLAKQNRPNFKCVWNNETFTWTDSTPPDEQRALKEDQIKSQRNELLYKSDWTQIPNNPLTLEKQQDWEAYRQALRDITSQSGYPYNVVWPTPPQG